MKWPRPGRNSADEAALYAAQRDGTSTEFPTILITERNPEAARQVGARIRETIELLTVYPNIGREGALAGTRELVVPSLPYIVVHRIETGDDPAVTILGVYHGAQARPGQEAR